MVNVDVIQKILNSLKDNLSELKAKQAVEFEEYKKSKDIQAIVERRLETSIQACIDIGNHIISSENMGTPSNYGEIFLILMQNSVIDQAQADKLSRMAGFRNILIHEYRDILIDKVYDILQNELKDFYSFVDVVLNF
ncbi:MAG: DUF86 domain-containing protein, partial [Candidatus Omnitrophota bacterium]